MALEIDSHVRSAEGAVTRTQEHGNYLLVRRNPFGFWKVEQRLDGKPIPVAWTNLSFTTPEACISFLEKEKKK